MNTDAVDFVLPGSLDSTTGGTRYDRRMVEALRAAGRTVRVHGLPGSYPAPDVLARDVASATFSALPDGAVVVVDGLALGALPDVAAAHAARLRLVALVHHPLCDETGIDDELHEVVHASERRALEHVRLVVVTSRFTKDRLAELGLAPQGTEILAVEPGVDAARPSLAERGGGTFSLLSVGALTPRKAYDDALRALDELREFDWRWTCVGRLDQDPASASATESLARELDLTDRVTFTGEGTDAQLEALFSSAHILVHPAHYEGYGMVVAEALARGIPVVASSGGALRDTVPAGAGLVYEPGDVDALSDHLARLLGDAATYERLREGAERASRSTRSWDETALEFRAALDGVPA